MILGTGRREEDGPTGREDRAYRRHVHRLQPDYPAAQYLDGVQEQHPAPDPQGAGLRGRVGLAGM